jgi:glycosyltransferase involved in cell wall biosynthesis
MFFESRHQPRMNKIIHLTSVHGRHEIRTFLKECVSLARYGYDVSIIIADGKGDEIKDGVKIYDAGPKTGGRLSRMTKTVSRVYEKAKTLNGDIYHFHDPELIPVGLKLKKQGKKVIYDSHEDYGEDILNKGWLPKILRNTVANIFDRYEKKAAKSFDGIVTATPHIRKKFEKINKNTIDINNYPILNVADTHNFKETLKGNNVNYVGAIGRIRGIIEMVRALEGTEARLVIAGKFSSMDDFKSVKSMKGWAQVDYRGQVDRPEIVQILAESAAGLVLFHPGPNHTDSQPNKLFEYMAAGLPVIASNFPLWKEIVEKNGCGICVNPLNSKEIADAINWVLKNPSQAAEMGRNGRKAVLEKYNWEAESKKLIKFYEEILQ